VLHVSEGLVYYFSDVVFLVVGWDACQDEWFEALVLGELACYIYELL
jgi:hypothetical protein